MAEFLQGKIKMLVMCMYLYCFGDEIWKLKIMR